jgi:hypothetical protein
LGDRLIRRGLGLAGVSVAATADAASVPTDLLIDTARIATDTAALPAPVLSLSSEVIAAMTLSKFRLAVVGGLAALAVAVPGVGRFTTPTAGAAPPPTTATAAKDPLDRIKLTRLTALLRPDGIQQDLGLTDDQKKKIDDAGKKLNENMQGVLRGGILGGGVRPAAVAPPAGGGGGGGGGVIVGGAMSGPASVEMSKAMAEHTAACDKAMLAALSEAQVHRLKQIYLQTLGAAGLLDRRVIRALELTADQEDEIEKVLPTLNGVNRTPTDEQIKVVEEALAAAVKVLNETQKEKWVALVGKPVPTTALIVAAGPTGGSFSVMGGNTMIAPAVPANPKK